jgi:hypothetical protein
VTAPTLLIDAHVHLHDCYAPGRVLDHAAANFERAADANGWEMPTGALLFTESAGVDRFARLEAGGEDTGDWAIERTADAATLLACHGARRLLLVAGRQVVTGEGLEVLLLGTRVTLADGQPIREVLAQGERAGALRVVPWGVGKWLFARGRLLDQLIEAARPGDGFFLGDSGGRPFFWTRPRHFALAARRGIPVLPGTDPLPFRHQVARPGSFGFRLAWPAGTPLGAESIKARLRDRDARLTPYGRLEGLGSFIRHQIGMQLRKRRPAG